MALNVQSRSVLAVTAVGLVSIGAGLYGLSGHAAGQESAATETITVQVTEALPMPTAVQELTTPAATGEAARGDAGLQAASDGALASTSPRLQAFRKISAALDDETLLEFNESPLSDVVDYLKSTKDIPIIIDRRRLDDMGMGSDTPVTVSFSNISLRSGLARLLGELDLDYVISNEALVITSKEAARAQLDPRCYETKGLQITETKLIEIITGMVAPDTWQDTGGTGKITSLEDDARCLVIAQTDQIHDQIADLLEKLRQVDVAGDASRSGTH